MWDFSFAASFRLVLRTWPFVLLRLVVYAAICTGFAVSVGLGAGIGWSVGHLFAGDGPSTGAMIGALGGFGLVWAILWWARQYLVYIVKAGHVAALDALLHGKELPTGSDQIAYATAAVNARFLAVNVLFGIDLLIRGVVRALVGMLNLLTGWIPGMRALNAFVNAVLKIALGLVDEIILAYIIRREGTEPAEAARDGLVLYAQNAGAMARNAVWIALMEYALAAVILLILLGPALGLAILLPGGLSGFGVVFAFIAAWALKAALIEPLSIASLLQAYDIAIDGQTPDPAWTARLDGASSAFRDLAARTAGPRGAEGPLSARGQAG
ncbi:hypothetical protein NVS89_08815 [Ancylobacter sp. MQZ15Z-1]|uniref:Uncharacterized protein n=1 Tax=Ancylobacter mangrovi TaxID=2972472 RepID=A0A9X2PGX5_9HYPH|nr:hypothetical protein [Ancylobacter mangrovi]MCS0495197.1 hypothetical protein [Ancylobacter mangrovi]